MFLWFENHSVFTLKPSVIASMNGVQNVSKRSAQLVGKNKVEGGAAGADSGASGSAASQNAAML